TRTISKRSRPTSIVSARSPRSEARKAASSAFATVRNHTSRHLSQSELHVFANWTPVGPHAAREAFPTLTVTSAAAPLTLLTSLPDGVMVAQATLTRLVMVRIHVGQPIPRISRGRCIRLALRKAEHHLG